MYRHAWSILLLSVGLLLFFGACNQVRIHERAEWGAVYKGLGIPNACMLVRDHNHEAIYYYNKAQCIRRYLPASTFKIFNSLVALETAIAPDDQLVIPWDHQDRGRPEWNEDMTLRTAFERSNVPYFQELARRVGREYLQHYLDTCNYGNRTIGKSVDRFWLDNSLQISVDEQVGFLKRLYFDELPFSERTQRIVRSMMVRETDSNYRLSYKTGTGEVGDSTVYWVVGYAEKIEHVQEREKSMNKSNIRTYPYFFAQRFATLRTDSTRDYLSLRIDAVKRVLQEGFEVPIVVQRAQ